MTDAILVYPVAVSRHGLAASRKGLTVQKTLLTVLGVLGVAALCGVVVYVQISLLKGEIATLKREAATTKEKLGKLEKGIGDVAASQAELVTALSRPDGRTWRARATIALSDDEQRLVRSVIKVVPAAPGTAPTIKVDDTVPSSSLIPIPEPLVEKLPKLKGARFTVDRNGAIAIVGSSGRVEMVVSPG
jgi:hypothetical protein